MDNVKSKSQALKTVENRKGVRSSLSSSPFLPDEYLRCVLDLYCDKPKIKTNEFPSQNMYRGIRQRSDFFLFSFWLTSDTEMFKE